MRTTLHGTSTWTCGTIFLFSLSLRSMVGKLIKIYSPHRRTIPPRIGGPRSDQLSCLGRGIQKQEGGHGAKLIKK
ncbi:hypothetical protein GGR52DRAFT_556911 [Hypoxylon sp. FL1284]|nr:hypothetical protein GGR52DRAFT_556911 [Hypoxylon sp. FL1284]